jgi:hypothetical protein
MQRILRRLLRRYVPVEKQVSVQEPDPEVFQGWEEFLKILQVSADELTRIIFSAWHADQVGIFIEKKRFDVSRGDAFYSPDLKWIVLNTLSPVPMRWLAYHEFVESILPRYAPWHKNLREEAREHLVNWIAHRVLLRMDAPHDAKIFEKVTFPLSKQGLTRSEISEVVAIGERIMEQLQPGPTSRPSPLDSLFTTAKTLADERGLKVKILKQNKRNYERLMTYRGFYPYLIIERHGESLKLTDPATRLVTDVSKSFRDIVIDDRRDISVVIQDQAYEAAREAGPLHFALIAEKDLSALPNPVSVSAYSTFRVDIVPKLRQAYGRYVNWRFYVAVLKPASLTHILAELLKRGVFNTTVANFKELRIHIRGGPLDSSKNLAGFQHLTLTDSPLRRAV